MQRRKALLIIGFTIVAGGFWWLSSAQSWVWAWPARLIEGFGVAAVTTMSLAIVGEALSDSERKGRQMGFYRGLGSAAFAVGAFAGGRLADSFSLAFALRGLCSAPPLCSVCGTSTARIYS